MTSKELSKIIRTRRRLLKTTQYNLAEISDVSLRTIKAIEKGEGNPTLEVLSRILETLGLKLTTTERVNYE